MPPSCPFLPFFLVISEMEARAVCRLHPYRLVFQTGSSQFSGLVLNSCLSPSSVGIIGTCHCTWPRTVLCSTGCSAPPWGCSRGHKSPFSMPRRVRLLASSWLHLEALHLALALLFLSGFLTSGPGSATLAFIPTVLLPGCLDGVFCRKSEIL